MIVSPTPPPLDPIVFDTAWDVQAPEGDVWTARPWVHPSVRAEAGKAARKRIPRVSHAQFEPAAGRDPIAILAAQESDRLQELLPLRHQRMAESAFAYYRGTPAVMAFDLSATPRTDIIVQASGDSHISNFGLFGSPERSLVFDTNDFDETLPGPWEWDVKRLAASVVVAGRDNGFSGSVNRAATMSAVESYRKWMWRFAEMRLIDVWYSGITEADILAALDTQGLTRGKGGAERLANVQSIFSKARSKDQIRAFGSLTTVIDGRRAIVDDPPTIQHVDIPDTTSTLQTVFSLYRASLSDNRREFLERYRFVDVALKVVGVGSVGTRCFVVVLEGRDEEDPLILQAKQAEASVLEPYIAQSGHLNHGERVVIGQRLMQSTPDIFLGWSRGPGGRDFYFRQLWDMKGSVDITSLAPVGLTAYGALCGWALARAHARSGDAVAIAAYLGTNDTFDGAIADFSEAYADRNEADHRAYREAVAAGRISVPAPA
ncbi:MAG: DUF2252 domain-containing protein [Candidatus Limnocylindrales bacterium]